MKLIPIKYYLLLLIVSFLSISSFAQENYTPTAKNMDNREWFQDAKYGLFVHCGVYSIMF